MATSSAAAAPNISNLSLRGLQAGATTTLAIDGSELGADSRILLDVPPASQTLKPGASASHVEIEVALNAGMPPGIYLLRVAGTTGVSGAVPISIDALPQIQIATPAPLSVAQLPVALSGSINGSTVQTVGFVGRKGDRFVAEVESRRLGANLNPTLRLYNSRHVQIAWSQGLAVIGGDARLDVALPADGQYSVELQDTLFRGADPGFFRLKIGDFKYAGLVFPLGVVAGAATPLEFLASNLPPGAKTESISPELGERPAPWPAGTALLSGSRPKADCQHRGRSHRAAGSGQAAGAWHGAGGRQRSAVDPRRRGPLSTHRHARPAIAVRRAGQPDRLAAGRCLEGFERTRQSTGNQ